MAQHDMTIAPDAINNSFPDVEAALQALASCNMGATAPATSYAGQLWPDTTTNTLKIRDKSNAAWITLGAFDYVNGRFEYRANIYQAATAAGFSWKNSAGTTRMVLSDGGVLSGADITVGTGKTLNVSAGTLTLADNQVAVNKVAAATTTARGTVEKATTTEAQGGTVANVFPDVVGVKAAIDAQTTTTYKTAWVAGLPPINATTAYSHTLGVAPDNVLLQLECTTAEFGIVVGQVMTITSGQGDANSGVTIFSDASNTAIRRGNYPIMIHDGTTYALLTETSWKHRLIVQAIK